MVKMKITIKQIGVIVIGIVMLIIGIFGFAFHAMEIEDHYGDLQDFYFKSNNGDLMVFGKYKKIGLVDKTWTTIRIINLTGDTIDLFNWFYDDNYPEAEIKLYKIKNQFELDELNKDEVKRMIENDEVRSIFDFKNE